MLAIHGELKQKLDYFRNQQKIPNMLFYGPPGSGKKTIVHEFLNDVYDENENGKNENIKQINCSHSKGIKFIREDLKLFVKNYRYTDGGRNFKSVVLLNADKLTMDAQSALRRCIEQYSHSTRFFIIVHNIRLIMKPIISRFCLMCVPEPMIRGKSIQLYQYNIQRLLSVRTDYLGRLRQLKTELLALLAFLSNKEKGLESKLNQFVSHLIDKAYSVVDIVALIQQSPEIVSCTPIQRTERLVFFEQMRTETRCEALMMTAIIHTFFLNKKIASTEESGFSMDHNIG
jgi:hypothetical protein